MKCLSWGWYIIWAMVLSIILGIIITLSAYAGETVSNIVSGVCGFILLGYFVYFGVGLFANCENIMDGNVNPVLAFMTTIGKAPKYVPKA